VAGEVVGSVGEDPEDTELPHIFLTPLAKRVPNVNMTLQDFTFGKNCNSGSNTSAESITTQAIVSTASTSVVLSTILSQTRLTNGKEKYKDFLCRYSQM